MHTIENKVGRLIEVRFWSPIMGEEPGAWWRDYERMSAALLSDTYVFFIDLADAPVFPPDMIKAFAVTMRNEARLLRMAVILGSSPTLGLQMQRLVRDAQDPRRKLFRDPREAEAFLSEVLDASERARLHELTWDRYLAVLWTVSNLPTDRGSTKPMPVVRREFLEETDDPPNAVRAPGPGEDYALVIGVNDYPQIQSLRGAIADAQAFSAWLVDAQGGALRAENVRTIISMVDPLGPIGPEINDALEDVLQRAGRSGGRRFYFYFSGHGCVGDRANDLALCLANWSSLRRRAALSSEAWLDVIVRSGTFAEIAFFLDCCRVWATRAVGLPPHIDFPKPVERERGTRVFLAYATEFQRSAVEIDTDSTSKQRERRGIFTRVLIDGLRGMARGHDEGVTAASLKGYVEKATEQKARELGFHQQAEVMNGFYATARFGSNPQMGGNQEIIRLERAGSQVQRAMDDAKRRSLEWVQAYTEFRQRARYMVRHVPTGVFSGSSRLHLVVFPRQLRQGKSSSSAGGEWSIYNDNRVIARIDDASDGARTQDGLIIWADLAPGAYVLRRDGSGMRELAVYLYPHWTTAIVIDESFEPHFENARILLTPITTFDVVPTMSSIVKNESKRAYLSVLVVDAATVDRISFSDESFHANPIRGFLVAHWIARQNDPDVNRIASIAHELESVLGSCPDVDALRLRAALLRGGALPRVKATHPPMLREGLLAFVEASHKVPDLIPPGSLLEYACIERFVDSPLSSWPIQLNEPSVDDWLTTSIAHEVTKSGDDAATLDATTIAQELGVPTQAVTTRMNHTRAFVSPKNAPPMSLSMGDTSSVETVPIHKVNVKGADVASIPGYEIEGVIGQGGMGIVYLAKRITSGARVAVKVIQVDVSVSREARQRFLREIDTLAVLQHDRIVTLLDHGEANGSCYFAMSYYERGNVADWVLRNGVPNLENATGIILDLLEGLAHAHKLGYVHRDIKPQNILLDNEDRVVLADFGLAKPIADDADEARSRHGQITPRGPSTSPRWMGTPAFMAPEQVLNFRLVRPPTDVWAVAAVFYWLLSGATLRGDRMRGPIISIRERLPQLPSAISELMDQALSPDPSQRPADADWFRVLLEQAMLKSATIST